MPLAFRCYVVVRVTRRPGGRPPPPPEWRIKDNTTGLVVAVEPGLTYGRAGDLARKWNRPEGPGVWEGR